VVVSVTETDLNRILRGTVRSRGGPVFEGRRDIPSKGITDLRYRVSVSDPVLRLGADGEATIALSILDGSLDIGKYQRRIGGRTRCARTRCARRSSEPVDVTIALRLAISGSLCSPERVSIPKARTAFRLVKPGAEGLRYRAGSSWIGKPRMKNRLGSIGDVLLASFKKSAGRLEDGGSSGKSGCSAPRGSGASVPRSVPGAACPRRQVQWPGARRQRRTRRRRRPTQRRPVRLQGRPSSMSVPDGSARETAGCC
jgi:hypothetical protein